MGIQILILGFKGLINDHVGLHCRWCKFNQLLVSGYENTEQRHVFSISCQPKQSLHPLLVAGFLFMACAIPWVI